MTPLLVLDGVSVARDGRRVLDRASLRLDRGERLALVGANGAGKTTILRTLVGLEHPVEGTVSAFGRQCRVEADFIDMRARVGFLFQDPDDQLFCPTVLDDVAFGPLNLGRRPAQARDAAAHMLESLGLAHLATRVTHRLSGGEKRLVSLASILVMAPDVLLLDEPTNALDEVHRERMITILSGLDASMLIVSHDHAFLERMMTRGIILAGGRLAPAVIHRHRHVAEGFHIHGLDADHVHDAAAPRLVASAAIPDR